MPDNPSPKIAPVTEEQRAIIQSGVEFIVDCMLGYAWSANMRADLAVNVLLVAAVAVASNNGCEAVFKQVAGEMAANIHEDCAKAREISKTLIN